MSSNEIFILIRILILILPDSDVHEGWQKVLSSIPKQYIHEVQITQSVLRPARGRGSRGAKGSTLNAPIVPLLVTLLVKSMMMLT